jgi:dinuclear metal center YbgI/SA1388 family protein
MMMSTSSQPNTDHVVRYLDEYLRVAEIPDDARALNGLQVENSGRVRVVMGAVDASQAAIDAAASRGPALLLVHHGIFWSGLEPLRGRFGRRVRALHQGDVALYSAHIPLDCHPEVGNNAVLARDLGLTDLAPFGRHRGIEIGVSGGFAGSLADLAAKVERRLGVAPRVIGTGPVRVDRVAIVTGAASDLLAEARERGIGTFLTGEGPHHRYFEAEEWGLNLIYAVLYATETVGIHALGEHLRRRFSIEFQFFDHPTGL